jgi:polygalacturonase
VSSPNLDRALRIKTNSVRGDAVEGVVDLTWRDSQRNGVARDETVSR